MKNVGVDPKKLLADAMSLTEEQRADLAMQLLQTLPSPDSKTEADRTAEIVRRAKEVEDGTAVLFDLDDVRRELEARSLLDVKQKNELLADALTLPEDQREEFVRELLASLGSPDTRSDEELAADIERRVREVHDGTAKLVEWDEVRERLRQKLKKP